jgi:hypothetical protein
MIEALLVPVVKKAVDFLFDEGREILKAHFGRREEGAQAVDGEGTSPQQRNRTGVLAMVKEDALSKRIDEASIERHKTEIEHLLQLQEIQSRNYHLAKEQEAIWGKELVPAIVANRVIIAEKDLAQTTLRIGEVLDSIYR